MLLTLDDLRQSFGFDIPASQETRYEMYLETAEEACLSYASIDIGSVTEYFRGSDILVLSHSPVLEVQSVTSSDGSQLDFRYEKRAESVVLSAVPAGEVIVKYTCGWVDEKVPATLKTAIAFTVQQLAKLNAARLLGVTSRTTEGGTEVVEQSIPPLAVQKMLDPFRVNRGMA